jgi:hypothetical protein
MKTRAIGMSLLVAFAVAVPTQTALAARIAGKQCAGMISTQRNPHTDEVTRSCRTADGGIATESVGKGKARKVTPKTTN